MKNMKKSFIFIMLIMMVISISAVCATEDVDNIQSTNDDMHDVETLNINDIDEIINANVEELANINEVGPKMAESIVKYFNSEQVLDTIQKLKEFGVNMKGSKKELIDNRFEGLTFVLTGTLPTYSRDEASEIILKYGGKTSSSVSKKTNYVLAGEEAGSKLKKAEELGIKIISEEEFMELIR